MKRIDIVIEAGPIILGISLVTGWIVGTVALSTLIVKMIW
jgi:hypothetical protein